MGLGRIRLMAAVVAVAAVAVTAAGRAQVSPPDNPAPAVVPSPEPFAPALRRAAAPKTRRPAPTAPLSALPALPPPHPGVRLAPGQVMPAAELEAFVDGLAAQAMARDHVAGAVVAVVQNGQLVLGKGYGVDRLSPARPVDPGRTLFRLGPITETFTWIGVMREIEAGHMRLDAPVNQYLPQDVQIPDQGFIQPVRVRDLMSQSAAPRGRRSGSSDPSRARAG